MGEAQAEIVDKKEGILKKIRSGDYGGARTLVLEALKGSPRFEHASEMPTIFDILCSGEIELPKFAVDWCCVLQLFFSADPDTIKALYQKLVRDAFPVLLGPVKRLALDTKRYEKVNNPGNNNLGDEAATGGTIAGSPGTKRPPHELRGGSGDVQSTEHYSNKKPKQIFPQAKSEDGIGLRSKLKGVSGSCSAPLVTEKSPAVEASPQSPSRATSHPRVHVLHQAAAGRHAEIPAAGRAEGSVSTASVSDVDGASRGSTLLPRWEVIQRRAFLELINEFVDSLSAQGFDDPASVAKESRTLLEIIKATPGLRVGAVKRLLQHIAGLAEEMASVKRAAESVGRVDGSKIEEAKARLERLLMASMEKEEEAKAAAARQRAVIDDVAHLEGLLKRSRAWLVGTTRQREFAEAEARIQAEVVSAHREVVSKMVEHFEWAKGQLHALEESKTHLGTQLRSLVKALKKETTS